MPNNNQDNAEEQRLEKYDIQVEEEFTDPPHTNLQDVRNPTTLSYEETHGPSREPAKAWEETSGRHATALPRTASRTQISFV